MNEMSDMELIAKALIVAEKKLIEQERQLADLAETVVAQEEQIQAMAPKADFFDELVEQNLLMSIRQTAKELDIRKNDFVSFLLDNRFCYRDTENKLQPFYRYVGEYFELVEDEGSGTQMMITPKGREAFRLLVRARATA